jgi:hypothetical protein
MTYRPSLCASKNALTFGQDNVRGMDRQNQDSTRLWREGGTL